jgi:hypothetical protein
MDTPDLSMLERLQGQQARLRAQVIATAARLTTAQAFQGDALAQHDELMRRLHAMLDRLNRLSGH